MEEGGVFWIDYFVAYQCVEIDDLIPIAGAEQETIGNKPIVRISKLAPPGVDLFVKLEAFNPIGSIKDRLASGVIEDMGRSGRLSPGQTVVEATSGDTGIGLAMLAVG